MWPGELIHRRQGLWNELDIGVSNLSVSLDHPRRGRVVLGHTLNTLRHIITKYNVIFLNLQFCVGPHSQPSWDACGPWAAGWTPLLEFRLQSVLVGDSAGAASGAF